MVFVIQNTQTRYRAMHIKIDELIRVAGKARTAARSEELDDKTLELLRQDYEQLARKAKSQSKTPDPRQGGAETAGQAQAGKSSARR